MNRYQYAKDEQGNIIHYLNAKKGITYYCLECGGEMIFCSGEQRTYFKHKNPDDFNRFNHNTETYLHNTAKLLYAEKCKAGMLKVKIVPRCSDYFNCDFEKSNECFLNYNAKEFNLMDYCNFIGTEKMITINESDYIADILLETKDKKKPILLEVCVTHKCEDKKLKDCKVFEVKIENEDDIDRKLPVMYVPNEHFKMDFWCACGNHDSPMCVHTCPNERPQNSYQYQFDLDWYRDNSIEYSNNFRYNCQLCKSLKGTCNKKWDCPGYRLAYSRFYPRQYWIN